MQLLIFAEGCCQNPDVFLHNKIYEVSCHPFRSSWQSSFFVCFFKRFFAMVHSEATLKGLNKLDLIKVVLQLE